MFPAFLKDTPFLDGVKVGKTWLDWFQGIGADQPVTLCTTSGSRGNYNPARVPLGSKLIIEDWDITLAAKRLSGEPVWRYESGVYRSTLADKPSLSACHAGFLFHATDYLRTFRWTGSAWTYADGEKLAKEIIWYPGTLPSGYALCDGSSVTVTLGDATTASFTTPDLTGQFLKGGTYTGSVVSATAPGLTGDTAAGGDHNHGGTASVSVTVGGEIVNTGDGTTGSQTTGADGSASGSATISSSGTHTHGKGTLAVDATGQPAHVLLLPCVKL
jgi:hypothetical protein